MSSKLVVARLQGGLGNQLFCYAAARRLALVNGAELVLDDVTGFARDRRYRRRYALDRFHVAGRRATPAERYEPFERPRRGVAKWLSRRQPFAQRRYLEQEGIDFDQRLLAMKVTRTLYLDGLWQSEGYFKDVEQTIRDDLRIIPPADALNQRMAWEIRGSHAVAVHARWFDMPSRAGPHTLSADYYRRAIALMDGKVESPHYFLFSDDPDAARARLALSEDRVTLVCHNQGEDSGYADMWLMSLCRHFITANSTFSWWGAWLGTGPGKVVVTPALKIEGKGAWGFKGLIPGDWLTI